MNTCQTVDWFLIQKYVVVYKHMFCRGRVYVMFGCEICIKGNYINLSRLYIYISYIISLIVVLIVTETCMSSLIQPSGGYVCPSICRCNLVCTSSLQPLMTILNIAYLRNSIDWYLVLIYMFCLILYAKPPIHHYYDTEKLMSYDLYLCKLTDGFVYNLIIDTCHIMCMC